MDPRFLQYYNRELNYIREMGGEFAREYPKIAARLGLNDFECADPYVERLLEGFAFLAARIQLKLDGEFPRFTDHLLEMVYPHYLCPTPSLAVVQFHPDPQEGSLKSGYRIPRGTALHSLMAKGEQTCCEYRTAHDVNLLPLKITSVEYSSRDVVTARLPRRLQQARAVLRVGFQTTAGTKLSELELDRINLFLRGGEQRTSWLYEQLFSNLAGVVISQPQNAKATVEISGARIERVGFDNEQALLPYGDRSFHGYRLLQEYFAFPQRFLFADLVGLGDAIQSLPGSDFELLIAFDKAQPSLEHLLDLSNLALFCTPAVNLFPKRADRIHVNPSDHEHHVVPDRTRPMDYEVYQITDVRGFMSDGKDSQEFEPFYAAHDVEASKQASRRREGYYTIRRTPRVMSSKQRQTGARSSYIGTESYLSLVDPQHAPFRVDLAQLEIQTLCTNRDLPLQMPVGHSTTDFTLEIAAPVQSIRCVAGPTEPKNALGAQAGENSWRLISHLSLNYLSLTDSANGDGAAALRQLLDLYRELADPASQKQIDGIRSVKSVPIVRRLTVAGPLTFGRGLEVQVTCDESSFEGYGVFLLGSVLAEFFAKYVSINSFTETVLNTLERGEVKRWPTMVGRRRIL